MRNGLRIAWSGGGAVRTKGKFINLLAEDLKAHWKCCYKYPRSLYTPSRLEHFLLWFVKGEEFYDVEENITVRFKILFGKLFITSCRSGGAYKHLLKPGFTDAWHAQYMNDPTKDMDYFIKVDPCIK